MPKYACQSANPIGRENIIKLLQNFEKFQQVEENDMNDNFEDNRLADYSLSDLEESIFSIKFNSKALRAFASERRDRLNENFVMDKDFLKQFIVINNRLIELASELYDNMLFIKKSLDQLVMDEHSPIENFYLEGIIAYENRDSYDCEIVELLCGRDYPELWSINMSNGKIENELPFKQELLMKDFNWDDEIFDIPLIKNNNIYVCYMMHSFFCHGYFSLVDLMQMEPEYFYLSIRTSFDV